MKFIKWVIQKKKKEKKKKLYLTFHYECFFIITDSHVAADTCVINLVACFLKTLWLVCVYITVCFLIVVWLSPCYYSFVNDRSRRSLLFPFHIRRLFFFFKRMKTQQKYLGVKE